MKHSSMAVMKQIVPVGPLSALFLIGILMAFSSFPVMTPAQPPEQDQVLRKIVFGSCIQQDLPTPIFFTMAGEFPDLILFLGDNIYADTEDMTEMRAKYDRLNANADFRKLQSRFPIMATWDDHDFGVNDGGADYPQRVSSEQEFLRFWQVPADSSVRKRPGVYDAKIFGPEGKRVQIILLDTRYFRSPLRRGERRIGGPYVPDNDPAKTMLGETQWRWLEQELKKPAELRLIGTSIQFLPEARGQEGWGNLPLEHQRLIRLIAETKAAGVIFLSGDRHWAELSVLSQKVPYPLHELTSSSFNQIHPRGTPTENCFRADERTYHRENYGVVRIDWTGAKPSVTLDLKDIEAGIRIEKQILIRDLQPN